MMIRRRAHLFIWGIEGRQHLESTSIQLLYRLSEASRVLIEG